MAFAFEVVRTVREQEPELFDDGMRAEIEAMMEDAIACETLNPFDFMDLQDVQEVTNFFERRVSAYQVGVQGEVAFDVAF
jgi:ribonucleoside-diphosphate reductase beta chain